MNQNCYLGNSENDKEDQYSCEPTIYSPYESLPNPFDSDGLKPNEHNDDISPSTPSIRQSPASALPPFEIDSVETNASIPEDQDIDNAEDGNQMDEDDIPLNPDIDKPSPPRLGKCKENRSEDEALCRNPFELSDEETFPVEPEKKLSPSHVFESTTLEQSLLLGEDRNSEPSKTPDIEKKTSFDSGTFVIRKGSATPKSQLSPSGSIRSNISNVSNGAKSLVIGSDELGASMNPIENSEIIPNDIPNYQDKLL